MKRIDKRGRGRPPIQAGGDGNTPTIALRLPDEVRKAVDKWAQRQEDTPGRSEAIRRLIEQGLRV
jgi:hypothetical protein